MGLEITRSKKGYNIKTSETGDQLHHKKWISKKEAKKIFIEQEVKKMVDKVIQIDMDFPNGFTVNGEINNKGTKFHKWINKCMENQDFESINDRYYRVMQDYEIGI